MSEQIERTPLSQLSGRRIIAPPPTHDAEERIRGGLLKGDVEPELVAIERKRGRGVPDDEERRNACDFNSDHTIENHRWTQMNTDLQGRNQDSSSTANGR